MLSLFNSSTALNAFSNTKCAEVYCQTLDSFSIVCTFCEMKNFEFEDFLLHFRNVHLDNNYAAPQVAIKTEDETSQIEYSGPTESANQLEDSSEIRASPRKELATNAELNTSLEADTPWENDETDSNESNYSSDMDKDNSKDGDFSVKILKPPSKTNSPTTHECVPCGKTYKYANTLEYHKKKYHSNKELYKCEQCESEFVTERSLGFHVQSVHLGYPCDHCDKIFKNRDTLRYHKLKHSGVRPFVCDVANCGKAFFQKKRLVSHQKFMHTEERNYVCETCGFATKTTACLVLHKRTHTGEKPFVCKLCDKRFASRSSLVEHEAIHSTAKPHICDVCGASFTQRKSLYHHKHLHLDIKKFVCKICGKAYAQAAGLCGHMRQHNKPDYS